MDVGIFGGTFDPVHQGHLKSALAVKEALGLDQIIIMPNRMPYYKDRVGTSDADRLAMLKLATQDLNGVKISTWELEKTTYSYTFDNMVALTKEQPQNRLVFIMGTDSFLKLHTWYRGLELLSVTNIAVMKRPQNLPTAVLDKANFLAKLPAPLQPLFKQALSSNHHLSASTGELFIIDNPETDISSTELRHLLTQKRYVEAANFMDPKVISYIKDHELYSA